MLRWLPVHVPATLSAAAIGHWTGWSRTSSGHCSRENLPLFAIRNRLARGKHVLEPLHGYMMLAERLYSDGREFAEAWNFGPPEDGERTVAWIIDRLYKLWDAKFDWVRDADVGPPEANFLKIDAAKARTYLGWRPKLDLPTTLEWIIDWTRRYESGDDMYAVSIAEIDKFMAISVDD